MDTAGIFISHATANDVIVAELHEALKGRHAGVYFDCGDVIMELRERLKIRECERDGEIAHGRAKGAQALHRSELGVALHSAREEQ